MRRLMCMAGAASLVASTVAGGASAASAASASPAGVARVAEPAVALYGGVEWNLVDAISADNVWAAGAQPDETAVFVHFNGRTWSKLPSPPSPFKLGAPELLGGTSGSNLWVADPEYTADIAHWNGKSWKLFGMPRVISELNGMAVLSGTDAWAAGADANNDSLFLHWNGVSWKRVPSPSPGGYADVVSFDMRSASSGWAVGYDGDGTMVLRWNGKTWAPVPAPRVAAEAVLYSVDAASPSSAWATGGANGRTFVLHWNGVSWKLFPAPSFNTAGQAWNIAELGLLSVAAISPTDAWATGFYYVKTPAGAAPVFLHWNGTKWSKVAGPAGLGTDQISAVSASDIWAVATTDWGAGWTIIRWTGAAWKTVLTS